MSLYSAAQPTHKQQPIATAAPAIATGGFTFVSNTPNAGSGAAAAAATMPLFAPLNTTSASAASAASASSSSSAAAAAAIGSMPPVSLFASLKPTAAAAAASSAASASLMMSEALQMRRPGGGSSLGFDEMFAEIDEMARKKQAELDDEVAHASKKLTAAVKGGASWDALPVQSAESKAFQAAVVKQYQKSKQIHVTGKQQFAINKQKRRENRKQKKAASKAEAHSDKAIEAAAGAGGGGGRKHNNKQIHQPLSSSGAMRKQRQHTKNKAKSVY